MSRRRGGADRGPGLFDLPLHTDDTAASPSPSEDSELDQALAGENLFDDPLNESEGPVSESDSAVDTQVDTEIAAEIEEAPLAEPVRHGDPAAPTALSLFPELDQELDREPEVEPAALAEPVREAMPVADSSIADDPPAPLRPQPVPDLPFDDPEPEVEGVEEAPGEPVPAALGSRLSAGLTDLAVMVAVGLVMWLGSRWMGLEPTWEQAPAPILFLLLFSALYTVIPLAFWGRTPGMTRAGLLARTADGEPLTFGQTGRRWLGGVLTVALLGLPVLLALGEGGSLADRMSGSETFEIP